MKRNSMFFVVLLCLGLFVAGCENSNVEENSATGDSTQGESTAPAEITAPAEVTTTAETNVTVPENKAPQAPVTAITDSPKAVIESDWEAGEDIRQKFNVNFAAYYTKDQGLTVGMGGEIHYTTDGGQTWPRAENKSNCCFGLDFVTDQVIFACGNGKHVVKSTDGGQNFTRVTDFGGSSPDQCKVLSFYDENNGVICSSKRMAITNDSGVTWKELTMPSEIMNVSMTSATTIYYVGRDLNLYVSKDSGTTWSSSPLNLPEKNDYINILQAIAFKVTENGYSVFVTQKSTNLLKHYISEDNAATWTEHPLPEIAGHYYLYLNDAGDVLTANNGLKMTAQMLSLK